MDIDDTQFYSGLNNDLVITDPPYTGSFTLLQSGSPGTPFLSTNIILHNFGPNTFPVLLFSQDNSVWIDGGSLIYSMGTRDIVMSANAASGSNNVTIYGYNYTLAPLTCYYKLILLAA